MVETREATLIDKETGEIINPPGFVTGDYSKMSPQQKWDALTRMRSIRKQISEKIAFIEAQLVIEMRESDASVQAVPRRGDIVLDRGTPAYDTKTISQLYEVLGENVCDAGNRKLVSTKVTSTEKVDAVRVRHLMKHGDSVKKIIADAYNNQVQRSPRIKLIDTIEQKG